jgi:hypothetical protein
MSRRLLACALLLIASLPSQIATDGPRTSPFRGMRAVTAGIEVQVADDTWFALEAVAGVDTPTLLREAERLCGKDAWKRITEDLPSLLTAMGAPVGDAVDLKVKDLTSGELRDLPAVKMTAANRKRVKEAQAAGTRTDVPAVPEAPAVLTPAAARDELQELRRLLDEQFAYRELRKVDLDALLRDATTAFGDRPVDMPTFTRAVDRILRAFGDGHSRIDAALPGTAHYLPFLVQETAGGHVAFSADRRGLLSVHHPFVRAIDGVPLAKWLAAAKVRGTQGSAVMQAREAERGLRDLGDLRVDLKLPAQHRVTVTLHSSQGQDDVTLDIATRRPVYGEWPRTATRRLDGDVGYLRIAQMGDDAALLDGIDAAMQSFRDTKGLVIDVRGNGGGTRDALRRLAPYLLPANGAPVVGNVAAVLLERGQAAAPDALADRGLFPVDWNGWTDAQRTAITAFARTWKPSWKLPAGKFSPWHFLVLDRADNPAAFAYTRKVVVLIDRGCFSATDVFAAALGVLPNVTLVGEATSGGSGRAKRHTLPNSGLRLQLSTMASFRPDGVLFEGNGVTPEVPVATQPFDLVGEGDTVLAKACSLLR